MSFKINNSLLVEALKIVSIAVVASWIVTATTNILLAQEPESLVISLKSSLVIATIVPILVGLPATYYILMQRQKIKNVNEKLARLLRFDQLTLLLSRRAFFHEAEAAMERLQGKKQPNAMLFLDVDHFKQVNDRFGHAMGDEVLRLLGNIINNSYQPDEIAGRIGGEEFCILVQDCSPKQALSRAQQLVDEFRSQAMIIGGKRVDCTLSIGIAVSTDTCDLDKLISEADRLLYIAKQDGRDCVAFDKQQQVAALTELLKEARQPPQLMTMPSRTA